MDALLSQEGLESPSALDGGGVSRAHAGTGSVRPSAGHQLRLPPISAQGDHSKQSVGLLAAKPLSSAGCIAAILIS